MEAVVLVEHLFHLVDLQKRCSVAFAPAFPNKAHAEKGRAIKISDL